MASGSEIAFLKGLTRILNSYPTLQGIWKEMRLFQSSQKNAELDSVVEHKQVVLDYASIFNFDIQVRLHMLTRGLTLGWSTNKWSWTMPAYSTLIFR